MYKLFSFYIIHLNLNLNLNRNLNLNLNRNLNLKKKNLNFEIKNGRRKVLENNELMYNRKYWPGWYNFWIIRIY